MKTLTENEIMNEWIDGAPKSDAELRGYEREMESIGNLNDNPMSVLTNARKAMRRAFMLGAQFGAKSATKPKP